jgi:hypothetical protein
MREPGTYSKRFMEKTWTVADLDIVRVDGREYVSIEDLHDCMGRLVLEVQGDVEKKATLMAVADPNSDRAMELCDEGAELMGFGNGLLMLLGLLDDVVAKIPGEKALTRSDESL